MQAATGSGSALIGLGWKGQQRSLLASLLAASVRPSGLESPPAVFGVCRRVLFQCEAFKGGFGKRGVQK